MAGILNSMKHRFANARFIFLYLLLATAQLLNAEEHFTGTNDESLTYTSFDRGSSGIETNAQSIVPGSSEGPFSPVGKWRGVFLFPNNLEVPFNFDVNERGQVFLLNAEERFEVGKAKVEGDSLFIPIDQFDNELVFGISSSVLHGQLRKQDKKGFPIPVNAEKDKTYRFAEQPGVTSFDMTGTYDIQFLSDSGKPENAVGLFKQEGNALSATFMRITGDSRYLQGVVQGDTFYLSSFIGSSPVYYKGVIADGRLTGRVQGIRGGQAFTGQHNEEAALPDPYKLTFLKDGYSTLDFSFPTMNGKIISPKDEKYRNKVLIVTVTGTWCPNCIDEAAFLSPWYKENKKRGVEIISIHYERQVDSAYTHKVMDRFRKRFDIEYDEVLGGRSDKQAVAASLPALNSFLSFPTTIIIDKKGKVVKIHTGYSGPATGKYYSMFVKEFNEDIDRLLKE
jgi:peroxiredoxin